MYETGKAYPEISTLLKIVNIFDVSLDDILNKDMSKGNLNQRERKVPITVINFDRASAGDGNLLQNAYYLDNNSSFSIPDVQFNSGRYVAIQVRGHSMEPTIMDGDWIFCRQLEKANDIIEGNVHLIVHDNTNYLKRIYEISNNKLTMRSDNIDFADKEITLDEKSQIWLVEMRMTVNLRKDKIQEFIQLQIKNQTSK